jgi:hypothetical protein
MKRKMAVMMTGVVLAMSATTLLPASAKGSHLNTQPLLGGKQQTQPLSAKPSWRNWCENRFSPGQEESTDFFRMCRKQ